MNLDLDWRNAEIECDGGPRPDGSGLRVSFAGPRHADGRRLRLVFGVSAAHEGRAGRDLPTNLTVIFEGEERLFATRGEDHCTVDELSQERVGGSADPCAPGASSRAASVSRRPARLTAMRAFWSAASISPAPPCSRMSRRSSPSVPPGHRSTMSERCQRTSPAAALWLATLGAWLAVAAASAQEPRRPLDLATFPRTSLEIIHHGTGKDARTYRFDVWVADTPERAEQGLMFVSDLPDTMGMVFPVDPPNVETMWMKNTYIELDMLFIDAAGQVSKIIERAAPLSLRTLSSDTPVAAVLELKGGEAARLGLRTGDTVHWKPPAPR